MRLPARFCKSCVLRFAVLLCSLEREKRVLSETASNDANCQLWQWPSQSKFNAVHKTRVKLNCKRKFELFGDPAASMRRTEGRPLAWDLLCTQVLRSSQNMDARLRGAQIHEAVRGAQIAQRANERPPHLGLSTAGRGSGVGWLDGGLGAHPSYASCHKRYTCTWPHANAIPSCSVKASPCYAFSACSRLAQGQTFKLSIPAAHVRRQQQRAHRLRACLWRSSRRWLVPARLVSEESAQDRFGEGGTHVRDGPLGRGPVVVAE